MNTIEPGFTVLAMPAGDDALALIERIGRVAYKSEPAIDDGYDTCSCGDVCNRCRRTPGRIKMREPSSHRFVRMLLTRGHESVIEHCSATVLLTTNRGVTHELVRHRLASYTQESTRFCNYASGKFGSEIAVTERAFDIEHRLSVRAQPEDIWDGAVRACEKAYLQLREYGVPPELARDVLPNVLKADIVVTANFREWRHIFRLRCAPAAHPDMRALMQPLRAEFRSRVPIVFDEEAWETP